ncbi:hypothetical protein ACTNBM_13385 [Lachnospiraceae bacterium HCP1S3_C3]
MMNLYEFLKNWDGYKMSRPNAQKIFYGKIADMSEAVACRYWISKAGVKCNKEIMYIAVEYKS